MPEFELRALCVTVESGVVARANSRDVKPNGLERELWLAPGRHDFVLYGRFVAPEFPGYTFDVRSHHSVEVSSDTTLTVTAKLYEKGGRPINERPMMDGHEQISHEPSDGGNEPADAGPVDE